MLVRLMSTSCTQMADRRCWRRPLKKIMSGEELVKHINHPSHSGGTAVMFAAEGGHLKCTKLMINEGADVNAIAVATPKYLEKLAKMIKEGSVDPNKDPHVDGIMGVQVAAEEGHLKCVNLLIEVGADVMVLDEDAAAARGQGKLRQGCIPAREGRRRPEHPVRPRGGQIAQSAGGLHHGQERQLCTAID
jgi:ankyrin repeat protein